MSTATLPDQMRAIVITAPELVEYRDWPCDATPLGEQEVAGRTLVSLMSPGTELHNYCTHDREQAQLSGYAAVVELDACGAAVTDLRPGDRVFCMGQHASRQRLQREQAWQLPAGIDPAIAVFARLAGVSWTSLTTTDARPPDRVLVTGLGPVGILAAQLFAAAGYRVTAVEPIAARRELASALDIADLHESGDALPDQRRYQLAVECSGHEAAVLDCCRRVRRGGEVALVGVPWTQRCDLAAQELLHAVFYNFVQLRSGWEWELPLASEDFRVGSRGGNFSGAMAWLADGRLRVDGMGWRVDPADAQAVWQDVLHRRSPAPTAIIAWE